VFDADLVSSDPLGGFTVPLTKGAVAGGSGAEWHALGAVKGMGRTEPSGFLKLALLVRLLRPMLLEVSLCSCFSLAFFFQRSLFTLMPLDKFMVRTGHSCAFASLRGAAGDRNRRQPRNRF
jgi:hypothetical protein